MKGARPETSAQGAPAGKLLAERWGLEYREAHTLSIDPNVLSTVDGAESRRLQVLPLEFGPDGPVFAVAEPSEERFAAVRNLAGDNATFVIVARETLDALLNSKVFSVPTAGRRPSLFRARTDGDRVEVDSPTGDEAHGGEAGEAPRNESEEASTRAADDGSPGEPAEPGHGDAGESTQAASALDSLLTQIRTGAGSLRAQVEQLTASLETTQRELREAKEQLAEANRVAESHDEVVAGLTSELESLRHALDGSRSLNESMTARLEEVARALLESPSDGAGE